MQTIKATISRRNIGNNKVGAAWENVIRANRRIIGSIFEPCHYHPDKYRAILRVAPGYRLSSDVDSMPDALRKIDSMAKDVFNLDLRFNA